jgi:hypothetical protein
MKGKHEQPPNRLAAAGCASARCTWDNSAYVLEQGGGILPIFAVGVKVSRHGFLRAVEREDRRRQVGLGKRPFVA